MIECPFFWGKITDGKINQERGVIWENIIVKSFGRKLFG